MKRIFCFFCIHFFASASILSAQIIETENFGKITDYITSETLVILDVDDTLLIPTQTLGTDVWFMHRFKGYQNFLDHSHALDRALAEWEAIRHLTNVQIVEKGTDKIIEGLQNHNVVVMGLTTQGLALTTRTINQLHSLNIDLSKTAPSKEDHYFINQHGVLYRNGLLFTSGTQKGPALLKLLEIIKYSPKRVIFINDKEAHLQDVGKSVEEAGIDFIGLRYSYSDKRTADFQPKIADIQWDYSRFGHLLSDQEAEKLLKTIHELN